MMRYLDKFFALLTLLCLWPVNLTAQENVLYGVTMLGEVYSIDPGGTGTYIGSKERVQLLAKYTPIHSLAYVDGYFYAVYGTDANKLVRFGFEGGDEKDLEAFLDLGLENVFSMARKDDDSIYISYALNPTDPNESNRLGILDLNSMELTATTEIDTPHDNCLQGIAYDDSLVALNWTCELSSGNWSGDRYLHDSVSMINGSFGPVDGSGYSPYSPGVKSRTLAAKSTGELYTVRASTSALWEFQRYSPSPTYLTSTYVGTIFDDSSCPSTSQFYNQAWDCEVSGMSYGATQPTLDCDQLSYTFIQNVVESGTASYAKEGLIAAGKAVVPGYFSSQGIVEIEDTADITYTSGTKIILSDGFYVYEGAEFLAKIDHDQCS